MSCISFTFLENVKFPETNSEEKCFANLQFLVNLPNYSLQISKFWLMEKIFFCELLALPFLKNFREKNSENIFFAELIFANLSFSRDFAILWPKNSQKLIISLSQSLSHLVQFTEAEFVLC